MAETTPARTLHRKLAQIMYEAERIPKNGTAPREMGGYKFVQVGDAADYIRKELASKGLTMMPTAIDVIGQQDRPTKSGGSMTTLDLRVEWTITDGESGESITIVSFGAGADGGDKYSGKATTSAMKYALLSGFLLSTGEDSELGTDTAAGSGRAPREPRSVSRPEAEANAARAQNDEPSYVGPFSATGEIVVRKTGMSDGNLRQGPDGGYFIVAFKSTDGESVPQVLVRDPLAVDLLGAAGADLNGLVCTIEGEEWSVPFRNGDFSRPFKRIHLARISTSGWTLPAPAQTGPGLFDAEAERELDAIPL